MLAHEASVMASPATSGSSCSFGCSFGRAASTIALIYLVGLLILPFAPETKGKPLHE